MAENVRRPGCGGPGRDAGVLLDPIRSLVSLKNASFLPMLMLVVVYPNTISSPPFPYSAVKLGLAPGSK